MIKILRNWVVEISIMLTVGVVAALLLPTNVRIVADGVGYYDYLPSLFIHEDLVRKDTESSVKYERIEKLPVYVNYKSGKVNKYHCGTAILLTPFFLVTHFLTAQPHTGYEWMFQLTVLVAALFYLGLTLVFLKKLLRTYDISAGWIIFPQVVLVFGTNVLYYASVESSFSHVYSLFAVTAFVYGVRSYSLRKQRSHLIWSFLFLALIVMIRPVNGLVILFIPFIAGSPGQLRGLLRSAIHDRKGILLGIAGAVFILSIQCWLWYAQTGELFVYSYQNEGFNFGDPHFWGILFSFRKGLFVYTPVLLVAFAGLYYFVRRKDYFSLATFLIPFFILTYILSSWQDWVYGHSYGLRAYIDFYALFFIPFALLFNEIRRFRIVTGLVCVLLIGLNLVQTWQYKHFILHWYTMDFDKYVKVFLRTSDPFKGILCKEELQESDYKLEMVVDTSAFRVNEYQADTLYQEATGNISSTRLVAVNITLENTFDPRNTAQVELNVMDSSGTQVLYTRSAYLVHFADDKLNKQQRGHYWFTPDQSTLSPNNRVLIRVFAGDEPVELKNVSIRFFSSR